MAMKLPPKDVVIIGLGWTGAILAQELTDQGLDEYAGFSPAEWRAINRGNAERLFPRLKKS